MPEESSISELLEPTCRWSVTEDCSALLVSEFQGEVNRIYTLVSDNLHFIDPEELDMVELEACLGVVAEDDEHERSQRMASLAPPGNPQASLDCFAAADHRARADTHRRTAKAIEATRELIEAGTIPQYEVFGIPSHKGRKVVPKGLVEWWFLSLATGKTVDELEGDSMTNTGFIDEAYQVNRNRYQQELERQQEALASEKAHEERMLEYDRMAASHNQRMAYIRQKTEEHRRRKAS